jgi:ribonuclease BN (tRNA processing enzyme)
VNYWFDAGENCSYTAYLMGVDLLAVSDIFISHPHMDHVGGLGNLLWNIRKFSTQYNSLPRHGDVTVYLPNEETFNGTLSVLKNTEGNYKTEYRTIFQKITDRVLLKNEQIEVEARHNYHLEKTEDGWQSFSFLITAENKKMIYSGDIRSVDD